jgi:hypothetical protein
MVFGLRHKERHREIEHKKKLDETQSKKDKGRGKDSSMPESLNHKSDRKKPYDKGQKKTWFSDISESKDKDEPKQMHPNKEKALKGILASLEEIRKEKKLCLRYGQPNHWCGICTGNIMSIFSRKAPTFHQKK